MAGIREAGPNQFVWDDEHVPEVERLRDENRRLRRENTNLQYAIDHGDLFGDPKILILAAEAWKCSEGAVDYLIRVAGHLELCDPLDEGVASIIAHQENVELWDENIDLKIELGKIED